MLSKHIVDGCTLKVFLSLEKKNGKRRFIHALLSDPSDIQKRAVRFYENLYKSELTDEQTVGNVFLENLPQLSEEANAELSKALTLEELDRALQSMVWQSAWS